MAEWYHAPMEHSLRSLIDLAAEARRFVAGLCPPPSGLPAGRQGATFITLSGELGAGKTAFVQEVARALGVEEVVTSPTFVLEKIYQLPPGKPFQRLIHIDAYRLAGGRELISLGMDELMEDAGNLVLLEWPEKVKDMLPEPSMRVTMKALPDGSHSISYG